MKKLQITVKGKFTNYKTKEREPFQRELIAEEVENDSGYGQGKYICINKDIGYFDYRYMSPYDFKLAVKQIIDNYYGENAEEVTITEIE